jgi:hypothetical protein
MGKKEVNMGNGDIRMGVQGWGNMGMGEEGTSQGAYVKQGGHLVPQLTLAK